MNITFDGDASDVILEGFGYFIAESGMISKTGLVGGSVGCCFCDAAITNDRLAGIIKKDGRHQLVCDNIDCKIKIVDELKKFKPI